MAFKQHTKVIPFNTPEWAYQWKSPKDFESNHCIRYKKIIRPHNYDYTSPGKGRVDGMNISHNFSIEYGGILNTVNDAEKIRDELFRINIGLWGYKKNHDPRAKTKNKNKELVWLNYVPGTRESRRLMGEYIMTQKDFDDKIIHPDTIAFTDWGIDDHHPLGMFVKKNIPDTLHVYSGRRTSIPYRSLVSKDIKNLWMAGRCMSVTHLALGGVRVMRPMCATGQAAGTASAISTIKNCTPSEVGKQHIKLLQQTLLKDGCYLLGIKNQDPHDLALNAETLTPEIINGWNREIKGISKSTPWRTSPIQLNLKEEKAISSLHLSLQNRLHFVSFDIEAFVDKKWIVVKKIRNEKRKRHYLINFPTIKTDTIQLKLKKSSGAIGVCEIRLYKEGNWTAEVATR